MIATITPQGVLMGDGTNITITEATGFESPNVDVSSYKRGGRHGSVVNRALWRERRIRLTFKLRASSIAAYAALRDQFIQAWNLPQAGDTVVIPFTTTDGKALQFAAQLSSPLDGGFQPGYITTGTIRVELIAPDFNFESQVEKSDTVYLPVTSGVALPHALPFGFARAGGSITVNNAGNGTAFPTVRIYGPVTNPHIQHAALGRDIALAYTIASGAYVDIDMEEETVLLNGTGGLLTDTSGLFWYLQRGDNTINFSADTYNAAVYALIKWRDSYTGV